jgi:hypothetical protein
MWGKRIKIGEEKEDGMCERRKEDERKMEK